MGGGTVWGWISYDPELNLIYSGTGNPGPWNADQRPGDNKWTCGIFARDADTGEARWFYQMSPHDHFDYDGVNEMVLLDLEVKGRRRKVLVHPDRNGYIYVMDRATGEVLAADPFVPITATAGVDLQSGHLLEVPSKETGAGKTVEQICPASPGAKDWQPSAFSLRTGLLRASSGSAPIRTTCPIRTGAWKGSRTAWRRWSPATSTPPCATPGGRSTAVSSAIL